MGKPLFPGKSVAHQLDLITDLLGTPSLETIAGVCLACSFSLLIDSSILSLFIDKSFYSFSFDYSSHFYWYCLGSEWEGQEILDRNEKEISSAVFTKVSQCGSYSHLLIAKAISIWSEGSTIGCGGKSFVYFDCYFTNVNLGIMKLCSEQSLSSFHYNEIKPFFLIYMLTGSGWSLL